MRRSVVCVHLFVKYYYECTEWEERPLFRLLRLLLLLLLLQLLFAFVLRGHFPPSLSFSFFSPGLIRKRASFGKCHSHNTERSHEAGKTLVYTHAF